VLLEIFWIVSLIILVFSTVYSISTFVLIGISLYEAVHQKMERGPTLYVPRRALKPAISLVVPAYNEEQVIVSSVGSMLKIDYDPLELVVVDDGSTDATLARLTDAFGLIELPVGDRLQLRTEPVERMYVSTVDPRLRVVHKQNGGRSDAINAGIDLATHFLVAITDADSMLDREALRLAAEPFITDPEHVIGSGGAIRIANGSVIRDGQVVDARVPQGLTAATQVSEYLRAFFATRPAWARMNGLLILSGAFGIYRRDLVVALGGLSKETLGEDMELTLRVHHRVRPARPDARIAYVPEAICWTEVPTGLHSLRGQRVRWHVGLLDNIRLHREMLGRRRYGAVGLGSLPYTLLFEAVAPLLQVFGLIVTVVILVFNLVNWPYAIAFFVAMTLTGQLQTGGALLIQDVAYPRYKVRDLVRAALLGLLEIFWYQPLTAIWRLWATWLVLRGNRPGWGSIPRGAALGEGAEVVAAPLPR